MKAFWAIGLAIFIAESASADNTEKVFSVETFSVKNKSEVQTDKSFQSRYCANGKQSKSLKLNLLAVLPKAPKGLPIDKAANIQRSQRNYVGFLAQRFFQVGRDLGEGYVNNYALRTNPTGFLTSDNRNNYVKGVKDLPFGECYRTMGGDLDSFYRPGCMTFLFFPKEKSLVLTLTGVPTYHAPKRGQGIASLFDGSDWISIKDESHRKDGIDRRGNVFMSIGEKKTVKFQNDLKDDSALKDGLLLDSESFKKVKEALPKLEIVTLDDIKPLEGLELIENYTLLFPLDDQRKIFPESFEDYDDRERIEQAKYHPDEDLTVGFFVKANGDFNLRNAIEHRLGIWEAYFDRFTQIKESPGSDAQELKYEISLDLNPFCKYGRSISDLTSN